MHTLAEIARGENVSERRVRLATKRGGIQPCRRFGILMVFDDVGLARIQAELAKPRNIGGRKPRQTAVA